MELEVLSVRGHGCVTILIRYCQPGSSREHVCLTSVGTVD